MNDLRRRFGKLVRAHRTRMGWTQEALAERSNISVDMVTKIEGGSSGARFRVIEQLSGALGVDPAELFTSELPEGQLKRSNLTNVTARLASLTDDDLRWLEEIVDAALKPRR